MKAQYSRHLCVNIRAPRRNLGGRSPDWSSFSEAAAPIALRIYPHSTGNSQPSAAITAWSRPAFGPLPAMNGMVRHRWSRAELTRGGGGELPASGPMVWHAPCSSFCGSLAS